MQVLVSPDAPDVAYFCGSGEHCGWTSKGDTDIQPPACFRFSLQGDTLKGDVLWHGGTIGGKQMWGGNAPWMVVSDGKFFHRDGHILDALTGAMIAKSGGKYDLKVPPTTHMLQVAGDHVCGLRNGSLSCYTLDGSRTGQASFEQKPLTSEQQPAHLYVCGNRDGWTEKDGKTLRFSYSETFTFGGDHAGGGADRIYVRSMYNLICIGGGE